MMNAGERKELIDIGKESVRLAVRGDLAKSGSKPQPRYGEDSILSRPSGVFVTLTKKKNLRGCLGLIVSDVPLAEAVSEIAGRSATEDPRFPPVTEEELDDISIEISVLSPLREISTIEEIQLGAHGIFLQAGMYRGLLLPQVAVQHHWDREQFLAETCVKAGLPRDQWKHAETRIYVFTTEIIEEK
ncbi:MAG TPA: AmmeMemoRadiSam system protein A [Bacteroidota bacterium]|nr:AmmeMemoRadiSam system protein A [Bacteroidota bacterium]